MVVVNTSSLITTRYATGPVTYIEINVSAATETALLSWLQVALSRRGSRIFCRGGGNDGRVQRAPLAPAPTGGGVLG